MHLVINDFRVYSLSICTLLFMVVQVVAQSFDDLILVYILLLLTTGFRSTPTGTNEFYFFHFNIIMCLIRKWSSKNKNVSPG